MSASSYGVRVNFGVVLQWVVLAVVAGVIGNAAYDGIKRLGIWVREWYQGQRESAAESDRQAAERMARSSQQLALLIGVVSLYGLMVVCAGCGATLLILHAYRPELTWLYVPAGIFGAGVLVVHRVMRLLFQVADELRRPAVSAFEA